MNQETIKILIIDDQEERVYLMQEILEKDFKVLTAGDAKQALEVFRRESPQICIIDMHLTPSRFCLDGVGNDVLREIKDLDSTTICLMYKGFVKSEAMAEEAMMMGAEYIFYPPVSTEHFMNIMTGMANRVRRRSSDAKENNP